MYERELFNARIRIRWSQAEVAAKIGVNQATISRWEDKGVPPRIQVDSRPVIEALLKTLREEPAVTP